MYSSKNEAFPTHPHSDGSPFLPQKPLQLGGPRGSAGGGAPGRGLRPFRYIRAVSRSESEVASPGLGPRA